MCGTRLTTKAENLFRLCLLCVGLTTKTKTCSVCVYVFQNIAETPASTSDSKVCPSSNTLRWNL